MGPDFIIGKPALMLISTNFLLHINASRIAVLNLKYTFLCLNSNSARNLREHLPDSWSELTNKVT